MNGQGQVRTVGWIPRRIMTLPLTQSGASYTETDDVMDLGNAYGTVVVVTAWTRIDDGDGTVASLKLKVEEANQNAERAFTEVSGVSMDLSGLTTPYVVEATIPSNSRFLRLKLQGATSTTTQVQALVGYEAIATIYGR